MPDKNKAPVSGIRHDGMGSTPVVVDMERGVGSTPVSSTADPFAAAGVQATEGSSARGGSRQGAGTDGKK